MIMHTQTQVKLLLTSFETMVDSMKGTKKYVVSLNIIQEYIIFSM